MIQHSPILFFCCSVTALVFLFRYWREKRLNPKGLLLPPGPRPLPIIGNFHQAPKDNDHDWLVYTQWGNKYGPLVYFRLFGQPVILINSRKVAVDLLEKRSGTYSDRPRTFIMAGDLVGWNKGVTLRPSGLGHRKARRLLNGTLNPSAARKLWPLQEAGALKFLNLLAEKPARYIDHIRATISETVVMVAFGQECSKDAFPYIEMAERTHKSFTQTASPYAYAVDILPILRYLPEWFPGAKFKQKAKLWYAEVHDLVHFPYGAVKSDLEGGKARPSYVANLINTDEPLSPGDEEDIMWSAASLYTGGVDTTNSALIVFMLAMCLNPDVQAKAQAELDRVIGNDRLPNLEDRSSLPYINACVKEVLRWWPITPLGVQHRAMQADYYEGYYIPEGATVISNIWAISRDPAVYKLPDNFIPDRFLESEERNAANSVNAFGFGRRICPGMHMADASLFIYIARTLATFNIMKAKDANGVEIEPKVEYVPGAIMHPAPFKCSITTRSERASQLIKAVA